MPKPSPAGFALLGVLLLLPGPAWAVDPHTPRSCDPEKGVFYGNEDGSYCVCPNPSVIVFDGWRVDEWWAECWRIVPNNLIHVSTVVCRVGGVCYSEPPLP